jgi:zeaxanthin glucosyltransferase
MPLLRQLPNTHEQPGVAARIRYTNTGRLITLDQLTPDRLRQLVKKVLSNPQYREEAQKFQKQIDASNPLKNAGDIIECDVLHL